MSWVVGPPAVGAGPGAETQFARLSPLSSAVKPSFCYRRTQTPVLPPCGRASAAMSSSDAAGYNTQAFQGVVAGAGSAALALMLAAVVVSPPRPSAQSQPLG